ncbi:3-deoxy-manno-octulosonate cytidylyltransferase (CMP-KDO synthetase) [Desulfonauticus submarinus]|uniref:3-deoxy-manno-octulosonate cytidylyltransferase n=1 Tax=Desulfonauticus submarinus TaxID=206665 RepID=A0A1G9ZI89_9BACT|nr:3-deoxy-manno-octulosonate cytidylyltransferase [Desulfonauticus submarinus]SDN20741.1 3-deoxy-manno-octulosonate cytidylyltransferase (CMP-KDO synthetase) [Desulfonauticus submarinus]
MPLTTSIPFYGFIPARYASTRFPGKALAEICGKPMFWHVYTRAKKCKLFKKIYLATDHQLIFQKAQELNIPVILTSSTHKSGTDRILEAAEKLALPSESVIANIQGDEPLINPEMLKELLAPFKNKDIQVTTLAKKISEKDAENPNQVKVVIDKYNFALFFSRSKIPYPRNKSNLFLGHIGLYAYRYTALKKFACLKRGELERIESLEQLRFLENQIPIYIVKTNYTSIGVDTPEDLEEVKQILKKQENINESNVGS